MPFGPGNTFGPPDRHTPQRVNSLREFGQNITRSITKAVTNLSQTTRDAMNADLPVGAWAAAAEVSSKAPTLSEIRRGSFAASGWMHSGHARKAVHEESPAAYECEDVVTYHGTGSCDKADIEKEQQHDGYIASVDALSTLEHDRTLTTTNTARDGELTPLSSATSPKIPWTRSTIIGLRAFWKWFLTPFGFLVTIYALNVVAWGGMLFLLLCNAAPAMCWVSDAHSHNGWVYDCGNLYSSRRIWMEIDSQILNALFCVTGLGLIPWRFRDLYYLLRWRLLPRSKFGHHQKLYGLRTLAGLYRTWVRLPGSETLDRMSLEEYNELAFPSETLDLTKYEVNLPSIKADALDPRVPWRLYKTPPPPVTGVRAPPTALWKIDVFVWCNIFNTFFQACLCGFMWGMNRFDRPSWSTGLFIALACIVSGIGGILSFTEGRKIKRIEGVQPDPVEIEEMRKLQLRDSEGGRQVDKEISSDSNAV